MGRLVDYSGKRLGSLVVLSRDTDKKKFPSGHSTTMWKCRCDCGKEVSICAVRLSKRSKPLRSCGCKSFRGIRHGNSKTSPSDTSWNSLVNRYKQSARRDGRPWSLSNSEAVNFFTLPCNYCGTKPASRYNVFARSDGTVRLGNPEWGNLGWVKYNGLDRVDNLLGYVLGNVVACCKRCNYAKGASTADEFTSWLDQVVRHRKEKCE